MVISEPHEAIFAKSASSDRTTTTPDVITDDELYFGSKRISLQPVPGRVEPFFFEDYTDGTLEVQINAISKLLARRGTMTSGDGIYNNCVLPGLPCLDIERVANVVVGLPPFSGDDDSHTDISNLDDWPAYLLKNGPVIKIPYDPKMEHEIRRSGCCFYDKAVASGVRSCLVKTGSTWYRLKGCGNNQEGFVVRVNHHNMSGKDNGSGRTTTTREIRGSAFQHTALRELYIANLLEKKYNIQEGANTPVGMLFYDHPNAPLGADGSPFQPVCIVEKTLGDRRLGSHLLAGMDVLLPMLVDEDLIDVEKLLESFPSNRRMIRRAKEEFQHDDNPFGMITTAELMTDHLIGLSFGESNGLNWPQYERDEKLFNHCFWKFELPEVAPPITSPLIQYTKNGPKNADEVNEGWMKAWRTEIEKLTRFFSEKSSKSDTYPETPTKAKSLLPYIYSRIGYEAGLILRKLHKQARISWGTFSDALTRNDMDQLHCNAHTNNLVVVPFDESGERRNILSFVDLDMAFGEKTCLDFYERKDDKNTAVGAKIKGMDNPENLILEDNITSNVERDVTRVDQQEVKVGLSKEDFDTLLQTESINFMEVLVGGDSNLGMVQTEKEVVKKFSDKVKLVKIALYDTMLMAYISAYNGDEGSCSESFTVADFDEKMYQAAYSVIRMALIIQADLMA